MGIKVGVVGGEWGTRRGGGIDEKIAANLLAMKAILNDLVGSPEFENVFQWEVSLPIMATEANQNHLPDLGHLILPSLVLTYDGMKKESSDI